MDKIIGSCLGRKIAVAAMNATLMTIVNTMTAFADNNRAGMCRFEVRGLSASTSRSTSRLNAIAADRAVTMQMRIPTRSCQRKILPGVAQAITADSKANGNANTVWLKRMSSRKNWIFWSMNVCCQASDWPSTRRVTRCRVTKLGRLTPNRSPQSGRPHFRCQCNGNKAFLPKPDLLSRE